MARPLRLEFAGVLYHVTSRGNRREAIYEDDGDRKAFLAIFADVCDIYQWACLTYCLMDNHYHHLIETPEANLAKGMRQLNGVYTQKFNRTHGRAGHVFQGRYIAMAINTVKPLTEILCWETLVLPGRWRMSWGEEYCPGSPGGLGKRTMS